MDFLVFVKVFGIFATVICAYVGIFASWMLQGYAKTRDGNNVVKRANCVAAGVLLSVALVHVLPDAIGDVGLWAPILAGCSYILLFGLEIAVGGMFAVGEALEVEGDGDGGSLSTEPTSSSGTGSRTGGTMFAPPAPAVALHHDLRSALLYPEHAAPAGNAQSQQSQAAGGGAFTPKGCGELGGRAINTDDCKVVNVNVVAPDGTVVQSTTKAAVPDLGVVKATLLFAALMVHSVLEGLGMGSADNVGVASSTLIAIVAHKGLAAFALGQTLLMIEPPKDDEEGAMTSRAGTEPGGGTGATTATVGVSTSTDVRKVVGEMKNKVGFEKTLPPEQESTAGKRLIVVKKSSQPEPPVDHNGISLQARQESSDKDASSGTDREAGGTGESHSPGGTRSRGALSPQRVVERPCACVTGNTARTKSSASAGSGADGARLTVGDMLPSFLRTRLDPAITGFAVIRWSSAASLGGGAAVASSPLQHQHSRTNSGVQNHEVTLAAPLLQHLSSEGEARPEFVAIGMDDPPLREPEHVACSKARTRFLVFTTIFAFSSPLGAVLGLVFFGNGAGPWSAYCSALTAGTFLQISMNELIPAALSAGGAPLVENLKRLAALCAGFGAMSLMALLGA
mmetsp:Transcript_17841/g.44636  ORF Transcript_17841/g.44636 Transcript_17841/m.44636 type:complete len:624 (+) Transcript_17841:234-2105(+)